MVTIDFGYAFGVATSHLPVPELVPLRLTPQILGLMEPLGTHGLFRYCAYVMILIGHHMCSGSIFVIMTPFGTCGLFRYKMMVHHRGRLFYS